MGGEREGEWVGGRGKGRGRGGGGEREGVEGGGREGEGEGGERGRGRWHICIFSLALNTVHYRQVVLSLEAKYDCTLVHLELSLIKRHPLFRVSLLSEAPLYGRRV